MLKRISALLVCALFASAQSPMPSAFAGGGGGTGQGGTYGIYSVVQHVFNICQPVASGSPCAVTVSATTAGNLLIIAAGAENITGVTPVFAAASGDGTWTHPTTPGCYSNIPTVGITDTADCAYRLSAAGGATSITWTWTGDVAGTYLEVIEVAKATGAMFSFDTAGGLTNASCVTCPAPTLTITSVDYILQWATPWNKVVAITGGDVAGYQSPADFNSAGNFGVAGAANATSGAPPSWLQTGAAHSLAMSAIAFK
jgi:hypothetical protein